MPWHGKFGPKFDGCLIRPAPRCSDFFRIPNQETSTQSLRRLFPSMAPGPFGADNTRDGPSAGSAECRYRRSDWRTVNRGPCIRFNRLLAKRKEREIANAFRAKPGWKRALPLISPVGSHAYLGARSPNQYAAVPAYHVKDGNRLFARTYRLTSFCRCAG